ncbi:uroporphyrinogen-III synthase [Kribbella albertanoniae]|uniref:Uroporphyrinogen-III synthase n=1 Tax=Kribbella albertanoniae TaxID=1266829 RepID=A0A4R4Q1D5_9ACTN|nr:uroporphyrinogen-III synthase [Kribbella albertanoniae]TDC28724.1 uroporphyrinogen-III synthase [Kribbella albertanoniae]
MTANSKPGPLSGCTLAVTAHRRADDLIASFERRGAKVLHAPTLQITPVADDHALIEATRRVIANPPNDVVVTTAVGFRGWIEAADTAGLAADLLVTLEQSRILARGPKARGAIRAAGLVEHWSARSETTIEVVEWLRAQGVNGRKIVVQLHGLSDPGLMDTLRSAGASVRGLEVYRWGPAPDPVMVERMIGQVCTGAVDAVVHTSAPGAQAMLDAAALNGQYDTLVAALRTGRVLNACVGPVTAAPFLNLGLEPLVPDRYRLGALIRIVTDRLTDDNARSIETEFGQLVIRGGAAVLDGVVLPLGPGPRAVLAALVAAGGDVVSRPDLLAVLPGAEDVHAVEVTVNRLRTAVGRPELVRTVVRRGYRLAVEAATVPS